jgi:hypothetical protein
MYSISGRMRNFYKRWNIELADENFENFKNRVLITIDNILGELFLKDTKLEEYYFKLIAKHFPKTHIVRGFKTIDITAMWVKTENFKDSKIYKIFYKEKDFKKLLFYLQALFWLNINSDIKNNLYLSIKVDIELSLLEINIKKVNNDIILYPRGSKLLDDALVDDVLDFLSDFHQKSYESFKSALEKYQNKKYQRNLLDDLRSSYELLLRKLLNNSKSLEKQEKELDKFLESKNVPSLLRQMFCRLNKYYSDYQNKYAKHDYRVTVNPFEVEFIIYLTGTFIRFLISLEENKNEKYK